MDEKSVTNVVAIIVNLGPIVNIAGLVLSLLFWGGGVIFISFSSYIVLKRGALLKKSFSSYNPRSTSSLSKSASLFFALSNCISVSFDGLMLRAIVLSNAQTIMRLE